MSNELTEVRQNQFGTRYLLDDDDVFKHNAWDNVNWNTEQTEEAVKKITAQKMEAVSSTDAVHLLEDPVSYWEAFYRTHGGNFFMERNWLFNEFPELNVCSRETDEPLRVLDVGCGAGKTAIPLLKAAQRGRIFVYACDFASEAVELLQHNCKQWMDMCKPFLWDITTELSPPIVEFNSLDCILCIYVLSALPPSKHRIAINNLVRLLKPGGILLLKDYAQFDMTQLRFKANRFINENFYRRGDGTLVYYFTQQELHSVLEDAGLIKEVNALDRRLIVNRGKRIKMYRMWVQCKYRKRL